MNEWKPLPHDEDLERADDLLDQADALLRRHRSTIDFTPGAPFHDAGRDQPSESDLESLDLEDEDLPILTEVVEDLEIADDWHPPINARPLDFGPDRLLGTDTGGRNWYALFRRLDAGAFAWPHARSVRVPGPDGTLGEPKMLLDAWLHVGGASYRGGESALAEVRRAFDADPDGLFDRLQDDRPAG